MIKKVETKSYLPPNVLEQQEHLSTQQLNKLRPLTGNYKINKNDKYPLDKTLERPKVNFVDLMAWVSHQFGAALKDAANLMTMVHNRIVVDGQFLQFCEEKGVSVECLHRDSIVSWKTDHNYEKFFAQGVFLIKSKNVEFLQSSLWIKGCQNDDEISFFVVVSEKNYEEYLKLRNEFDVWVQERDRSNLHIKVVDGDDIPYTKDCSWDDLFLPETIKNDLKGLVENFLNSKDFYLEKKIPWKRGVILWGGAGLGKTTIIKTIISEYNFKPVTIVPGANAESMREAFSYAEEQSPSLLYFEDIDSLIEGGLDVSSFLNLLDGISSKNGLLVIITANDVKKLKMNITQRPSRFDRKFEIPLPTAEMAYLYLKKWFGTAIDVKKCRDISKAAEKYGFSYAFLKEIYISSMFEALSKNRKTPTAKDIDAALVRIIKEKNSLNNSTISTDKYFS